MMGCTDPGQKSVCQSVFNDLGSYICSISLDLFLLLSRLHLSLASLMETNNAKESDRMFMSKLI